MEMEKRAGLIAARKAMTHMSKVVEMLERDEYCIDVLQQALAVQGLWKGVIRRIFANHMRTCFDGALKQGKARDQDRAIAEVIRVMELAERS